MSDSKSIANKNQFDEDLDSLAKILLVDARLIAVKNIQCSAGSSSGDNYMSVVKRVVVTGVDSENKETELSLIIKRQIPSLSRRQLYRCDEAFNNEINAYKYVIPMLEAYTRFKSCPKCQFAGKDEHGELIVLEDLKCLGYEMESRLLGLDFDHCKLVMEELATLHAASITVKHVDDKVFYKNCQYIKEIVYCPEADDFYKAVIETSIQESLSSLRLSNKDGSLSEPIRLISELETKLHRVIREYITKPQETYSVICHGDLWVNNIMFKKNSSGQVSSVKFLDLQAMRYASPVFDILHFIYTSTKRDVRDAYLREILEIYSGSLISKLKVHLYPQHLTIFRNLKALYSLQNIMEEFYSNVLYGLAVCMWVLPAVTFDPNNIPDLDNISDLQMSAKELNMTQNLTPEYHSRMKDIALEFYQNGFLNKN